MVRSRPARASNRRPGPGGDRPRSASGHGDRRQHPSSRNAGDAARGQEGRRARSRPRGPDAAARARAASRRRRNAAPRTGSPVKLVKIEEQRRREQSERVRLGRGTPRPPRARARDRRPARRPRRDEAGRRPRRGEGRRRRRRLRPRAVLLVVAARVPGRHREDGEGAGALAEPVEARRTVRAAQVLPALRVPDVLRSCGGHCPPSVRASRA